MSMLPPTLKRVVSIATEKNWRLHLDAQWQLTIRSGGLSNSPQL